MSTTPQPDNMLLRDCFPDSHPRSVLCSSMVKPFHPSSELDIPRRDGPRKNASNPELLRTDTESISPSIFTWHSSVNQSRNKTFTGPEPLRRHLRTSVCNTPAVYLFPRVPLTRRTMALLACSYGLSHEHLMLNRVLNIRIKCRQSVERDSGEPRYRIARKSIGVNRNIKKMLPLWP